MFISSELHKKISFIKVFLYMLNMHASIEYCFNRVWFKIPDQILLRDISTDVPCASISRAGMSLNVPYFYKRFKDENGNPPILKKPVINLFPCKKLGKNNAWHICFIRFRDDSTRWKIVDNIVVNRSVVLQNEITWVWGTRYIPDV